MKSIASLDTIRILRVLAWIAGALLMVMLLFAGWFALTFDANQLKPRIIGFIQDAYGRKLTIAGDLTLSFLPPVGVVLHQTTLSEPGSDAVFATAQRIRLGVSVRAWLSDRLSVDTLQFDGLEVALKRTAEGNWNFANLIPRGPSRFQSVHIDRLELAAANIRLDDAVTGRKLALRDVAMSLAPLAPTVPGRMVMSAKWQLADPDLSGTLTLRSGFTAQGPDEPLQLHDTELTAMVENVAGRRVDLRSSIRAVSVGRQALSAATFAIDVQQGPERELALQGRIEALQFDAQPLVVPVQAEWQAGPWSGKLASTVTQGAEQRWELNALKLSAVSAAPAVTASLSGDMTWDGASRQAMTRHADIDATWRRAGYRDVRIAGSLTANANQARDLPHFVAELAGELNRSPIKLAVQFPGSKPAQLGFSADVERVDAADWLATAAQPATPLRLDRELERLRGLNVAGTVRIGVLQQGDVKATNVRVTVE